MRIVLLASAVFIGFGSHAAAQVYVTPANNRADIILDPGWRFIRQDVTNAQNTNFDDSAWSVVNLPHTWNNLDGEDGGGNYYRGIGWYRTHYTVPGAYSGRHFFLKFDGAFCVADVWLNGNYLGQHQGGFAAFVFDATPYVNVGGDNVIAVKVDNSSNTNIPPLDADFTFFGGLYRDAHWLVTDPAHISPLDYGSPGVYLKPTNVSSNSANLQVTAVVSNANAIATAVVVRAIITDAATNIVAAFSNSVILPSASVTNVVLSATIANPHLWNGLADPYLYQAFVEIDQGTNTADVVSQPLGFRWFSVDPTNGFFLNGQHYDLHGVNMHQDWLNLGWALTNSQRLTNFMLLKEIGATAIRLSHYEHADQTYQLADQNGIVVWSEIPLIDRITQSAAFYTNALQQLREMIRQRYNHPSVVCWSVYNEITLEGGPSPTNLISQLVQLEAQEDSTRPSVAAANSSDNDPSTVGPQLIAFNKYYGWYSSPLNGIGAWADNFHATYPTRCVGVTEYGAGASAFQHTENPVMPGNTASAFHPEEWQNTVHEVNWQMMKARPFLWCKFLWNMFDFASDGRNEGDTPGRNDKGLVTYDRQTRKDAFYYYKANWTTNPMVYITGHTFTNRLTNTLTAKVYANCDSVELFLNGASQGSRTSTNFIFNWPITLLPNVTNAVQAVGTKGSSNVTDSLIWFGTNTPPAAAIVSPAAAIVYLNSTNDTSPSGTVPANTGTGYIGNNAAASRAWSGEIDDLRIYNRILSDAEVSVIAAVPPANLAPIVSAGSNQTVLWPAQANLSGAVTDDGKPSPPGSVAVSWSEVSGPGAVSFGNSNALNSSANFSTAGSYVLRLAANDGQVTTSSDLTVAAVSRPAISFQLLNGSSLRLAWQTTEGNWLLQSQTNSLAAGLGTNWTNVPGAVTNPFTVSIDHNVGTVFYRLVLSN